MFDFEVADLMNIVTENLILNSFMIRITMKMVSMWYCRVRASF